MGEQFPHLLSPGRVGDLTLPNRMLMSPMTRFRVDTSGVPTALNQIYYSQRASAGLIVSESVYVTPYGRWSPRAAGLHTEAQVAAWRGVTDAVHGKGGRMFAQIAHGGRLSHPALRPDGTESVAPSPRPQKKKVRIEEDAGTGVKFADPVVPRPLTVAEIREIVAEFKRTAARAIAAGFDGVEVTGPFFLVQF